ncbi:hypothetical protein ACFQL4_17540 [Halosimplex aquaticum]
MVEDTTSGERTIRERPSAPHDETACAGSSSSSGETSASCDRGPASSATFRNW